MSASAPLLPHRLWYFRSAVRQFHSLSRSGGTLVLKKTCVRPPSRSFIQLVEFVQKKYRDIWYEPLRIVYKKDKVSRARNILVYKSQRNILVPTMGVCWIITFCCGLQYAYDMIYLEEYKKQEDYDRKANNFEVYIPIVGIICWTVCVYRFMTRYVTRVYYNEAKKEFTLVTYNFVSPFSTMSRVVAAGTGRLQQDTQTANRIFPRVTYNCKVDGLKYMLHPEFFKYPVYFNVLFGYDDPDAIGKLDDNDKTADQIFRLRESDGKPY